MERTDFEQWKAKEVARLLALVETERRYYQEMVASLPVGLVVLSEDRAVVSANRAFRQTFGLKTEELRRKTIDQLIPSERLIEKIRDAHLGGPQADLFLEGERSLRIAIVPIRNWDDETEVETLLMVEDLSAIAVMRAGAQAPETAQPAPAPPLVSADVPALVWTAEAATLAFTAVSDGAMELLGHPVSHWLSTPQFFQERMHPDDRAATMAFYEAAIARGGDASAEYRAISASGGEVWCRETIRVSEPEGEARTITGVITDIGRRKQLEQQLLAAERTTALHSLASRLAHDLNNPLMIVTGYGEEMLHGLGPQDPMRGDVEQILAATERIAGITGQLLSFTHRQANAPRPVDMASMVAGLEQEIATVAGESVVVEIAAASTPVWAAADPEQLEEVILTLVSAAREDAQARTRVIIACEIDMVTEQLSQTTLKPGMYARLVIYDDGRGLDAEKRAAVFESILGGRPAEQAAGPALARAYAMVREWGGDIAFISEPSHGSTFAVYLPQAEAPAAPIEVPVQAPEPAVVLEMPAEQTRETILIVEDEPGIRALVRKILRRERYNVLEAGDGEEALSVAASQEGGINLLLTDVVLPGMSGRDVAERMVEAVPDVKVLYVSGYTDDEAVRVGAFPPGSRFLQKPFTLGALVSKVREALDA